MVRICESCKATPLDEGGRCVTCDAAAEGLRLLTRSGYASVREMMMLLEDAGLAPEMEKVPPAREHEQAQPLWNLYVPEAEVEKARSALSKDWAALLGDAQALAAAERGQVGVDLDQGGDVECPACGHRFTLSPERTECPECGLVLGAPADAAPDEGTG